MARGRRLLLPLAIAVVGFGINYVVATSMAETTDEYSHIAYGAAILHGKPDRNKISFDSKMPVSVLNALPRWAAAVLRDRGKAPRLANALQAQQGTRAGTIVAAFFLSLLVFVFAESLYGRTAGLLAQLLFTINPNLIAHSTVATTDLYIALGTVFFLYRLHRYFLSPTTKNAALAALAIALAQLTKFTAAYLYFVLILALAPAVFRKRDRIAWRQAGVLLLLTVVCTLAVIQIGFVFDRPFRSLAQFSFRSESFQRLQQVPVLRSIPLPVPYAYVQGFDWLSYNNSTGRSFGNIALLDEARGPVLRRSDGFPGYYAIAYLVKEPLGTQLLLLLSLAWTFRKRVWAELLAREGILLIAAAVFVIALSLFSKTQVGLRHILPALAIFAVLSGGAFQAWETFSSRRKLLLAGCVGYVAISVASYFPHMIPYFNEIVDRKQAYRFLADSNLDWGQDAKVVERFLKNNPDVVLNPEQRVAGRVLVRANLLAGVSPPAANYFMRREGLKPVAHVGYAHFLFVVSPR
jgi:4-amino-4-deoxy-L-arabinose transferase-like glycosyltransferase